MDQKLETSEAREEVNARQKAEPLFNLLKKLGLSVDSQWHEPVFTVEGSEELIASIPGGHTKNLFLKDKKGRIFLVVAHVDTQVDLKTLHQKIGAQGRLSFGDSERMQAMLGVTPGSVTIFGIMNDADGAVTLVLDANLMKYEIINGHPLTNWATTSISRVDLMSFCEATGHPPLITNLGDASNE
ncbi:prolyl-tRNA synthetase associated domain-containing protein [Aureimonas fodinaquatilis]|uniref:Prolyl-tRNA synthetase associated domain-containing protein n=1 Tax=Aureimonas fodinaquatilis TaxID=2565783 RepID=A0A5B0DUN5_9HYPH|nr:prolyl-tRNA synthetase associated domain-containing protein [Aureimonas fodinaquatilis]KAA0969655.1 prolyl-tRNA synthetase associated domain-containing protein [Aureimonas fodinaquatilis]